MWSQILRLSWWTPLTIHGKSESTPTPVSGPQQEVSLKSRFHPLLPGWRKRHDKQWRAGRPLTLSGKHAVSLLLCLWPQSLCGSGLSVITHCRRFCDNARCAEWCIIQKWQTNGQVETESVFTEWKIYSSECLRHFYLHSADTDFCFWDVIVIVNDWGGIWSKQLFMQRKLMLGELHLLCNFH